MTFGELFILARKNTVFTVFLGKRTSEHIEILDSDFGAGTKEAKILDQLMPKKVLWYIPGKMHSERIPCPVKYPHMSVVLETADCLKCSHRRERSREDPYLVRCENKRTYAYYRTVQREGCAMFKEATESELQRIAALDNMKINEE